MALFAVSMMRDEADIAPYVVRHLLAQGCDAVIVADNLSVDGTGELCRDAGAEVVLDPEPAYDQSGKMTALAQKAAERGAEWIIPFDADEGWLGLASLAAVDADVVLGTFYDHVVTPRDPPGQTNPLRRIGHRREAPQTLTKVAFRWHPQVRIHKGNHDVDHPGRRVYGGIEVRHFPYRSLEQMTRKVHQGVEALIAGKVPSHYYTHWQRLAALSEDEIVAEWQAMVNEPDLVYDPCIKQ